MTDLDRLLAAMAVRPWLAVLCWDGSKKPCVFEKGDTWPLTDDRDFLRRWVEAEDSNVGLMAGEEYGLAIIDVDDPAAFAELEAELGSLGRPTVVTASGKTHYYVAWEPGIPSTLIGLHGEVVGEPRRGGVVRGQDPPPWQMAVCPPSRVKGRLYCFVEDIDLTAPLPEIPPGWREYFARQVPARPVAPAPIEGAAPKDQLFLAALQQPGAVQRGEDIKFQCPACASLGRDHAQDNARLFASGAWGCAVYPKGVPGSKLHWMAIGIALEILGTDGRPQRGKTVPA